MSSISGTAFAVLCSLAALADGPPAPAPRAPAGRVDATGAVRLEYEERKLAEGSRGPQGELKAILAVTAVLKTDRPIRYRSSVLKAGSYPLSVIQEESDGGRNLYFVIGAPEEKKAEENGEAKKEPRAGKAAPDKVQRPADAEGKSPGGKRRSSRGPAATPGQIRALFHLSQAPRPSESVRLEARPTARGDRFSLAVRAGSSQGKVTLRFSE